LILIKPIIQLKNYSTNKVKNADRKKWGDNMSQIKKWFILILLVLVGGITFLGAGVNLVTDWWWFGSIGFLSSFLTILKGKIVFKLGAWLLITGFIFINLLFTKRKVIEFWERVKHSQEEDEDNIIELNTSEASTRWMKLITPGRVTIVYLLLSLFVGFIFSNFGINGWELLLKFINSTPFGEVDPLFSKDIGFYLFKLPFHKLIYQLLSLSVVVSALLAGIIYFITATGNSFLERLNRKQIKYHLSILLAIFFAVKAWGYRLDMFDLLYSSRGVVFGASYTDVNAQLLSFKILMVISAVIALFSLVNIFMRDMKFIIGGIVTLFLASLVVGGVYPALIQQYIVEPNEIAKESPYIKHNIDFTRRAFNLNKIKEKDFPIKEEINYQDLEENPETVSNIRLWDSRPLKATYQQLQEIRSYYTFNDIDVDRYKIDGELRQVMLGARELDQDLLSQRAQTWVNQKLNYTHGFGVAMSPVSKVTSSGLPKFTIKDIPPQSKHIKVSQPRIYYGESTNEYIIANTKAEEFDYPQGDTNKYNTYQGSGGVKLNSLVKKVAFSFKYGTLKILLNSDITTDSQLMFNRNIKTRVRKVAPFLTYDQDPYLVINDSGQLYWIQDAYTTSRRYPYSEPHTRNGTNYIRNSVKVAINAYTGEMDFYVVDKEDPIIKTYQKIFPELFTSWSDMPEGLKDNLRYPEELFKLQTQVYNNYHMTNPRVFYNQEDVWNTPRESYGKLDVEGGQVSVSQESAITMEPYYALMNLPEAERESFILMLPFTPVEKNNLISWLAAKSSPEDYGELILYKFSKQKLVYGPMQIEAKIDQHSEISRQLSLWNQRGSEVIRGNLLTIPIGESILYIEPIFLQAEQSKLPELKRVIASTGERVVMQPTLSAAIRDLFNIKRQSEAPAEKEVEETPEVVQPGTIQNLVSEISDLYKEAQEEQRQGNWSKYGELIQELEEKINNLKQQVNE